MKNISKAGLSILTCSILISLNLQAKEKLDEGLSQDHTFEKVATNQQGIYLLGNWIFSGDIRTGWLEYNYKNAPILRANGDIDATYPKKAQGHVDSKGYYIIPKFSIESPRDNPIRAKATVVAATDFGINNEKYEKRNFVFDPNERKPFMLLQEAYISYENGKNKFLVGREELTTPMVDSDDWYMLANSFELAYYKNSSLDNITFNLGYFHKMSGVWDSGANGTEFHYMADASFVGGDDKERAGNVGMGFASFEYNDEEHHNLQAWEYYVSELYNMVFLQYDYTGKISLFNYTAGVQFIDFKGVGKLEDHKNDVDGIGGATSDGTKIDYSMYSARFDGKFDFGLDFATGATKYSNGKGQGATLGAFGGYPYFANGMIFHFFEAGSLQNAASYKVQLGYDLSKIGVPNTWIGYRYTYFDLDSKHSFSDVGLAQGKMKLNGVRVSYGSQSGAYFTGTYESHNVDHEPRTFSLRLIGGYKF